MSKEALFNVLNNHFNFSGLKVLDLFTGTGNISFEFASRGVSHITSVDADFGCIKYIKSVSEAFNFDITVIKSDVFKFLEKHSGSYDIIFADPPYGLDQQHFEKIVNTLFERELLEADGMVVIEHSKYTKMDALDHYAFQKSYGGSFFSFFERSANDDQYLDEAVDDEIKGAEK